MAAVAGRRLSEGLGVALLRPLHLARSAVDPRVSPRSAVLNPARVVRRALDGRPRWVRPKHSGDLNAALLDLIQLRDHGDV